jgi:hypothetical protein
LIRISASGDVIQATSDLDKRALIGSAGDQDLVLAAWPGQWSQDIFVVDDLVAARLSLGLPRHQLKPAAKESGSSEFSYTRPELTDNLWRRLASVHELPPEGHRVLAHRSVENSWVTENVTDLIRRQDLDSEARGLILARASERHSRVLVAEDHCAPDEALALVDRFPDDADVLDAALQREDIRARVQERVRGLTYDEAASLWLKGQSWSSSRIRPGLASALLPCLLTSDPMAPEPNVGFGTERGHDRLALLRSVLAALPAATRLAVLGEADPGSLVQRAVLTNEELSDEELSACLPTITLATTKNPIDEVPDIVEYLIRFPRLFTIAGAQLDAATAAIVSEGWDPVVAARSGRWKELKTIAAASNARPVLRALIQAVTFDYNDSRAVQTRWIDPARHALLDALLNWRRAAESDHRELLKRLSTQSIEEVLHSVPQRIRINRLAQEELRARRQPLAASRLQEAPDQLVLPTEGELSKEADPIAILKVLLKSRGRHRDREVAHALSSSFMTDELAWTLPVKELERHPVYGQKLAAKVAGLCGNSSSRWKALVESWGQPTQLRASTLFKRILDADK